MKNIFSILATTLLFTAGIFINAFAGNNNNADNETALQKQKANFLAAKQEIESMLKGETPLDYEKAVFVTENAYLENKVSYDNYQCILNSHTNHILKLFRVNYKPELQNFKSTLSKSAEQQKEEYRKSLLNWAIFTYMTDTSFFVFNDSIALVNYPFQYSYDDPLATINWKNSQTLNLLITHNGNCYALTSLFKIFSERLKTDANIATAPGHIFIRHKDEKGTLYNIEIATHSFPGTGSMETFTYTTNEGVKNGIAMRTLNVKQSIGLSLVYLAKGYEYKFNTKDDDFILSCANLALQYDSLNLNAMLLKTELLEERIIGKKKTIVQLQSDNEFKHYEKLIAKLYSLGYREMPLEMKNIIISSLKKENYPIVLINHTPQPFKNSGVTDTKYATLSWGLFDEMHEIKPIEKYNRTVFNTKTHKIKKFESSDKLYNDYNFDPVVFAWSVDPMAKKQTGWSPYSAFGDNPIFYIDKEGNYFTGSITYINQLKSSLASSKDPNAKTFLAEIKKMEASEVEFNVQKNQTQFIGQGEHGKTEFDVENNRVVLNFDDYGASAPSNGTPLEYLAHEVEHGSEFLKGEISFKTEKKSDKTASADPLFYDITDEQKSFEAESIIHNDLASADQMMTDKTIKESLKQYPSSLTQKIEPLTISPEQAEQFKNFNNTGREVKRFTVYNYTPSEKQKESKEYKTRPSFEPSH